MQPISMLAIKFSSSLKIWCLKVHGGIPRIIYEYNINKKKMMIEPGFGSSFNVKFLFRVQFWQTLLKLVHLIDESIPIFFYIGCSKTILHVFRLTSNCIWKCLANYAWFTSWMFRIWIKFLWHWNGGRCSIWFPRNLT